MTEPEDEQRKSVTYVLVTIVITGLVSLILPVITCIALYLIVGSFFSHLFSRIRNRPIITFCCHLLVWIGGLLLMLRFTDFLHYYYHPWQ
jgi:hypothetical protein